MAAVAGAAALLASGGCGALGSSQADTPVANPQGLEKPHLSVGVISSIGSSTLYLARQEGYFAAEGLTVEPVPIDGGAAGLTKVIAGEMDVVSVNDVSAINAQVKHAADLRIIADGPSAAPNTYMLVSAPGSGISRIEDLPGKTVGVSSRDDIITLSLRNYMESHAVNPSTVNFIEVPYASSQTALSDKGLAATMQTEPYYTQTQQSQRGAKGIAPVADPFADGPNENMSIAAYTVLNKFAKENPKTVLAFQRAMQKAAQLTEKDPDSVRKILPTFTKIDPSTAQLMSLVNFQSTLNPIRLQRVPDLMLKEGALKEHFDINSILIPMPTLGN